MKSWSWFQSQKRGVQLWNENCNTYFKYWKRHCQHKFWEKKYCSNTNLSLRHGSTFHFSPWWSGTIYSNSQCQGNIFWYLQKAARWTVMKLSKHGLHWSLATRWRCLDERKTWRQYDGHIAAMLHPYLSGAIWWRAAELAPALTASLSMAFPAFPARTDNNSPPP